MLSLPLANAEDEFGRLGPEGRASKVERLGRILKAGVTRIRGGGRGRQQQQQQQNKAELVFLVDSSASVGATNFYNEIKFIRKLLADFTVSVNTTRVVIITYSSVDRVTRQVDQVSLPSEAHHKCRLLEREIPAITYDSGGTYTLGALRQALEVLQFGGRPDAVKAVFLITDGYSNGGDPRPTAELLKQMGVEFFTFGIRNGNVKELEAMASAPKEEHCFVLDSFREFEALARRALHEDLSPGEYLPQPPAACSNLCRGGGGGGSLTPPLLTSLSLSSSAPSPTCCHPLAECACGTHTGYSVCRCPPGYYGRGAGEEGCKRENPWSTTYQLNVTIKNTYFVACPPGTFKPDRSPGDASSCLPCPGLGRTTSPGAVSASQCRCREGHREISSSGQDCERVTCPQLKAPSNSYFVRGGASCPPPVENILNATATFVDPSEFAFAVPNEACGLRCRPGASFLIILRKEGMWRHAFMQVSKSGPLGRLLQVH